MLLNDVLLNNGVTAEELAKLAMDTNEKFERAFGSLEEFPFHKNDNFLQIVLEKLQHILHRPTRSLSKEPASSAKKKAKMEAVVEGMRKTTFKDTVQVLDDKGVESEVV